MAKAFFKFVALLLVFSANVLTAETNDDQCVSKALKHLDKAIELSLTISDAEVQTCAVDSFTELRNDIQIALEQKDYKKIKQDCLIKYENSDEILSECPNNDLRMEILLCICSMMKELRGF